MASIADGNAKFGDRRASGKSVSAAGAVDFSFEILRVNSFFHVRKLEIT